MYNETQLQAIRLFGDKTLSEGCIIEYEGFYAKIDNKGYAKDFERYITEDDVNHGILLNHACTYNNLGHEPSLFPDVARVAKEKGYRMEVVSADAFISILKISRWDIKNPTLIEIKDTLLLLSQPHLSEIVNLFSK